MIHIHEKEVNKIYKCNLLHDTSNPPNRANRINSNYSPILHGCTNNKKVRARFKSFQILLDSGCNFTILIVFLVEKLNPDKYTVMQWYAKAGHITTNSKVKVDFTLPELRAKNVVAWKCHVYEYAKVRYDMILGRDILT